jgi:hypothetical protein
MPKVIIPDTIEKRLKLFASATNTLFTVGALVYVIKYKLRIDQYFTNRADFTSPSHYWSFFSNQGITAALSVVVLYTFYVWRLASRRELEISTRLFSLSRTPQKWKTLDGHNLVAPLIILFYCIFFFMTVFIDQMTVFCPSITILYIISFVSHALRVRNLNKYFADPRYTPPEDDVHRDFILQRRRVAREYVLGGQHLIKESAIIFLLILASYAAINPSGIAIIQSVARPEIIVLLTLLANEITLHFWRTRRDEQLSAIDSQQAASDSDRMEE